MPYFEKILYFIIFSIPFSFAFNLHRDADIASLRVFISLTFIFLVFYLLYKNKDIILDKFKNKHSYFFSLFFLWAFLSSFWAINPVWSIRKALFFATIIPIYFLAIYFLDSKEKINKAAGYFIVSGFIISLLGVIQFFSQFIFSLDKIYNFWAYNVAMFLYGQNFGEVIIRNQSWFVNILGNDYFRAISLFPDPHTFALYLGLLIPFTVGYFLYINKKNKARYFGMLFIMFLALLFTFSRGAYVGFFISFTAILIFSVWYFKIRLNKKIVISISIGFVIIFLIFLNSVFGSRLLSSFTLSDVSNAGRIGIWETSLGVFKDAPFWGVGLGNLPIFFDPVASVKSPINAHNTYLDIASELGLVGLIIFFIIIFYTFKNLSFKKDKFNFLRFGVLWSLLWFLVHSFFETSLFSVPVLASWCFILAFAVILKDPIKGKIIKI
jgi:O-antigen ligase